MYGSLYGAILCIEILELHDHQCFLLIRLVNFSQGEADHHLEVTCAQECWNISAPWLARKSRYNVTFSNVFPNANMPVWKCLALDLQARGCPTYSFYQLYDIPMPCVCITQSIYRITWLSKSYRTALIRPWLCGPELVWGCTHNEQTKRPSNKYKLMQHTSKLNITKTHTEITQCKHEQTRINTHCYIHICQTIQRVSRSLPPP